MENNNEIVVPFSKKKLFLFSLAAILLILIGILIVLNPISIPNWNKLYYKLTAVASTVFFGICFVFIVIKLNDKSPGLIINSKGIIDKSSLASIGFIPWEDITQISFSEISHNKFITIHVKDPNKYINKGNTIQKYLLKASSNFFNSPIQLSSYSLRINFKELLGTLEEFRTKYNNIA